MLTSGSILVKSQLLFSIVLSFIFALTPPSAVTAGDVPNDEGGKIMVEWQRSPDSAVIGYRVLRQKEGSEEWDTIALVGRFATRYVDDEARNRINYRYKILAFSDTEIAESEPSPCTYCTPHWFDKSTLPALVGTIVLSLIFVYLLTGPKKTEIYLSAGSPVWMRLKKR